MLTGRTAAPLPDLTASIDVAGRLRGRDPVVIEAPPGAVEVAALTAQLIGCGRRPLWARLAPFELDLPALTTLARAASDGHVAATADRAPPASARTAAVVESPDTSRARAFLDQVAPVFDGAFGPGRTDTVVLHLLPADIGNDDPTAVAPPRPPERCSVSLLADAQVAARLSTLIAGRPGLLRGVVRIGALVGGSALGDAAAGAASADDLTRTLSRALLVRAHPEYRQRLRMAAVLGYAHQCLPVFTPVLADVATHPWWIPLENGWYQVDSGWRSALIAPDEGALPVAAVARVVSELVDIAAPEEALEFCLDAACPGLASDLLAEITSDLLAADRPRALRRWLSRLPPAEHARHAALLARIGPLPTSRPADGVPAHQGSAHPRRRRARRRLTSGVPTRLDPVAAAPGPLSPAPLVMSVRLLGAIDVRLDGCAVEHWHGKVGRTALVYVLLQRRRVPPDELAGALWPDVPATTARNRLHVALHRLRADLAAVDPRPVLVNKQGYALDPRLRLDLDTDRFERHAGEGETALRDSSSHEALTAYLAAVDCYGGELLAGERDDEWALLVREHYRVRLLDLLGKAAQLAFDLDRPALTVDLGHRLLALDFCREDLHRLLMRAYARLGQPQLALRQYQTCARQLRMEFGLDPAPATVELFNKVRGQGARLSGATAAVAPSEPTHS
jgi:DNA-binding SARP family transcriptional activator